jgi:hypothetical protein
MVFVIQKLRVLFSLKKSRDFVKLIDLSCPAGATVGERMLPAIFVRLWKVNVRSISVNTFIKLRHHRFANSSPVRVSVFAFWLFSEAITLIQIIADFRIRVASVLRDYSLADRTGG